MSRSTEDFGLAIDLIKVRDFRQGEIKRQVILDTVNFVELI